jgi:NAD(P)H-dependent FMN reductase
MPSQILILAGSTRRDSVNRKLARVAAGAVESAGGRATLLELANYPLPLYNGDLEAEQGLPDNARRLKDLFIAHRGLILVSPEYNSSIPALLKNTLDWVSRPVPEQGGASGYLPFQGKPAALMSASPGALGGMRGLRHLRDVLIELRVLVLPEVAAVGAAHQAFDADGRLADPHQAERVAALAGQLLALADRLAA